jgi:redox-sensing transcriptional repressor
VDFSAPGSRRIPEATVARLPLYLRTLLEFIDEGVGTVSSERLAHATGVNAAKVRKDLSHLGSYGTRGVGYDPTFLVYQIQEQLGLNREWRVGIAGFGNLGRALVNYRGFGERRFAVRAIFDADPDKIGTEVDGVTVRSVDDIEAVVRHEQLLIGIIATPAASAQRVADLFVAGGATGLLNFAPVVLQVPDNVEVRKVDLSVELQVLAFYVGRDAANPEGDDERRRPIPT